MGNSNTHPIIQIMRDRGLCRQMTEEERSNCSMPYAISCIIITYINFSLVFVEIKFLDVLRRLNSTPQISRPPGFFILHIAEFIFTKSIYERIFLQSVLDMRQEYFESLAEGRAWKGRWIVARNYLALGWAVMLLIGFGVTSKIIKTLWG